VQRLLLNNGNLERVEPGVRFNATVGSTRAHVFVRLLPKAGVVATWILWLMTLSGCAVYWHDHKTGTDHLWGFGHMTMKASDPKAKAKAIIRGFTLLGVAMGHTTEGTFFSVGFDGKRRIEILDENTAIELHWPQNEFSLIQMGTPRTPSVEKSGEQAKEAGQ
jgi:hypothetical protein